MSQIVGKIEGFDVHYVPEKDILFCKKQVMKMKDSKLKNVIRIYFGIFLWQFQSNMLRGLWAWKY